MLSIRLSCLFLFIHSFGRAREHVSIIDEYIIYFTFLIRSTFFLPPMCVHFIHFTLFWVTWVRHFFCLHFIKSFSFNSFWNSKRAYFSSAVQVFECVCYYSCFKYKVNIADLIVLHYKVHSLNELWSQINWPFFLYFPLVLLFISLANIF